MMITNQNQTNFQGNLLKKGLNLPSQNFREVAQLYAARTEGKPDLKLVGHTENSDFDGKFYHSVIVYRGKEDIADIFTADIKNMFKKLSPKKLANELVNLSKRAEADDEIAELRKKINETQGRLNSVRSKLKQNQPDEVAKNLQVIAQRMEESIAGNKKRIEKVKKPSVSNAWII